MKFKDKNSNAFRLVYFLIIFFSLLYIVYMLEVYLIKDHINFQLRMIVEILIFYFGFLLIYKEKNVKLKLLYPFIRMTFLGGIILSLLKREKASEDESTIILFSFLLPAIVFFGLTILTVSFHGFNANLSSNGNQFLPVNFSSNVNIAKTIIFTNLILEVTLIFGSFLFFIGSFESLLLNSSLINALIFYSPASTVYNLILPNGILEILSIFVSTSAGTLLLYYLINKTIKTENFRARRYEAFIRDTVIYLSIIATLLFFLAWGVEYFNITGYLNNGLSFASPLTYRIIISMDILIVALVLYIVIMLVRERYLNLMRYSILLVYPFLVILMTYPSLKDHIAIGYIDVIPILFIAFYWFLWNFIEFIKEFMNKSHYHTEKYPEFFVTWTSGRSMNPTIFPGDYLIFKKFSSAEILEPEEILCFIPRTGAAALSNEKYVCHRLIRIENDRIITKGDNNRKEDPWTPIYNIEGVLVARIMVNRKTGEKVTIYCDENKGTSVQLKSYIDYIYDSFQKKRSFKSRLSFFLLPIILSIMITVLIFTI